MSPETPLSAANRVARAEQQKQAEPDAAIHTEHLSLSHRYEYGPTCLVLPQLFSMCFHCDVNQPTRLATESSEAHRLDNSTHLGRAGFFAASFSTERELVSTRSRDTQSPQDSVSLALCRLFHPG